MTNKRRKNRGRYRRYETNAVGQQNPPRWGVEGGRYCPLSQTDMICIDKAVRETLQRVGLAEAPDVVMAEKIYAKLPRRKRKRFLALRSNFDIRLPTAAMGAAVTDAPS